VGAFPVWRPKLDELDVDSAPASAFLIPKSFKAPTQFAQNFLGNTPKGSKVPRNKEFLGVCYARPVFRF
jgi:hypothetical protein